MRSTIAAIGPAACLLLSTSLAQAQPNKNHPKLVNVTLAQTVKPFRGFIDDPFTFDGAGGRLLYVNADAGYLAELRVLDLGQSGAQLAKIDISKFTTTPVEVRFIDEGYFVVSRPSKTEQATAAIIDASGKVKRTFGPADHIALTTRDGNPVVAMYSIVEKKDRRTKGKVMFHHTVKLEALRGKKRYGKARVLVADDKGKVAKLDFRINHWGQGYTRVIGVKGGSWDAKEDQRSPDHEAWYDMVTGVFSKRVEIPDVIAHTKRMRVLAKHDNETSFPAVAGDLSRLELTTPTGTRPIELAQPFHHYDPKSLQYQPTEDGLFFFSLKIDPVNTDAVARKKADPEYLDLYEYREGDKKATRKARILLDSKRKRKISWRATEEYWVLVPRLLGFDRGGKELLVYKLK